MSKTKQTKTTAKDILGLLAIHIPTEDIFPVHKPDHYQELLGMYNMLGLRPIAYQLGHRFYWPQRQGFYYATTPEILSLTKKIVGTASILWMPTIDDMIMNAQGNGIAVSIHHHMKNQYYQTFITYAHDALYPELGNAQLSRFSSMDAWFAIGFTIARAFRRRMEEVGLESIKPVLYLSDPDFLRMSTRRADQFLTEPVHDEEVVETSCGS